MECILGAIDPDCKGRQVHIDAWAQAVIKDAQLRGLSELAPLLDGLVRATQTLRQADWNESAERTDRQDATAAKDPK